MNHGYWTVRLGRRLKRDIESSGNVDLEVFYDHGEKGESCNIVPYFGEYGTDTTLSNLDVTIVNRKEKRALVLCEFEEEGANPKLVIGDIDNIFIARQVRIKGDDFELANAKLILGVRVEEKDGVKKQNAKKKVESLGKLVPSIIKDEVLRGIEVITITKPSYKEMVMEMEERICGIINIPVVPQTNDD